MRFSTLAASLITAGFLCGCRPHPAAGMPQLPEVTVAAPDQQERIEYTDFTARLDASETVEIRPRVSGFLTEVRFRAGQKVSKGDVLFVINPKPKETALRHSEADLERARVALETAQREAVRGTQLLATRTLSPEEADTRQWKARDAAATVAAAEAAVNSARIELGYCEVKSPISGSVGRALVTAGNNVSGVDGFTTLLAVVVKSDPIHAYADVDEASFLRFQALERANQLTRDDQGRIAVDMSLANSIGHPFHGVIEHFDNRVDPATGSILLRAEFANPEGVLAPGLFARLRVPTTAKEKVLLIPEVALLTEQNLKFVYTVNASNQVEKRIVSLGGFDGTRRVVRSGLAASDRVVVNGIQRIQFPGMPVNPVSPTTPAVPTGAQPAAH